MRLASPSSERSLAYLALPARKSALALSIGLFAAAIGAAIAPPGLALAGLVLALGLAWASMIDIDRFILPDALTLGLVVTGLLVALLNGIQAAQPYIFGAIAGYLTLAGAAWIYKRARGRNGLGLGDAKLLAAAGAWLGWTALPFVILMASLGCLMFVCASTIWRGRSALSEPVSFGPYIAGAIWVIWLVQLDGRA